MTSFRHCDTASATQQKELQGLTKVLIIWPMFIGGMVCVSVPCSTSIQQLTMRAVAMVLERAEHHVLTILHGKTTTGNPLHCISIMPTAVFKTQQVTEPARHANSL